MATLTRTPLSRAQPKELAGEQSAKFTTERNDRAFVISLYSDRYQYRLEMPASDVARMLLKLRPAEMLAQGLSAEDIGEWLRLSKKIVEGKQ